MWTRYGFLSLLASQVRLAFTRASSFTRTRSVLLFDANLEFCAHALCYNRMSCSILRNHASLGACGHVPVHGEFKPHIQMSTDRLCQHKTCHSPQTWFFNHMTRLNLSLQLILARTRSGYSSRFFELGPIKLFLFSGAGLPNPVVVQGPSARYQDFGCTCGVRSSPNDFFYFGRMCK